MLIKRKYDNIRIFSHPKGKKNNQEKAPDFKTTTCAYGLLSTNIIL